MHTRIALLNKKGTGSVNVSKDPPPPLQTEAGSTVRYTNWCGVVLNENPRGQITYPSTNRTFPPLRPVVTAVVGGLSVTIRIVPQTWKNFDIGRIVQTENDS